MQSESGYPMKIPNHADIYVDGGVILKNPSALGGTWAYVIIDQDTILAESSGVVEPQEIGRSTVTNNYTELLAALQGLQRVDREWHGRIYTDSQVTHRRLISPHASFRGIPNILRRQILDLWQQRRWTAALVGGHPTKKELLAGRKSTGVPVSKWNVYVDKKCKLAAENYLDSIAQ